MVETDNWNGYSLFNDVEDTILRNQNRAAVMVNISSRHGDKGVADYFRQLPDTDHMDVISRLGKLAGVQ